jgi:hypothetical protein
MHYGLGLGPVSFEDSISPELFERERAAVFKQVWPLDPSQIWPNFVILIWLRGGYLTYHYWPTSHNRQLFEGNPYLGPAKTARERVAHQVAGVSFKHFSWQDPNTMEAAHSMLGSRAAEWVDDYQKELEKQEEWEGIRV